MTYIYHGCASSSYRNAPKLERLPRSWCAYASCSSVLLFLWCRTGNPHIHLEQFNFSHLICSRSASAPVRPLLPRLTLNQHLTRSQPFIDFIALIACIACIATACRPGRPCRQCRQRPGSTSRRTNERVGRGEREAGAGRPGHGRDWPHRDPHRAPVVHHTTSGSHRGDAGMYGVNRNITCATVAFAAVQYGSA